MRLVSSRTFKLVPTTSRATTLELLRVLATSPGTYLLVIVTLCFLRMSNQLRSRHLSQFHHFQSSNNTFKPNRESFMLFSYI
ncbi:hypothetical protein BDR03DRAFT_961289, partial [Suillus americanus]